MKKEGRSFRSSILVILIALVLVAQMPLAVFAGQVDDNYDYVEVVDSGDTMNYNGGVIEENAGTVKDNSGDITYNEGTVGTNNGGIDYNGGVVKTNDGYIEDNSGSVKINNGYITENNGTVENNQGDITNNNGEITTNKGQIYENDGTVIKNNSDGVVQTNYGRVIENDGAVDSNEGTVEVNRGYVRNEGPERIGLVTIDYGKGIGTVTTNYGTVYNAGTVINNKGKVFCNGGNVINDQGEHYFRVWFLLPTDLPQNAWSYSVDKGFTSYRDFDRWLEKNSVGQLTFRLNRGYGWEYDMGAGGDPNGYKARLNSDGSFTIIIDRMHEWLQETFLIIPLKRIGFNSSAMSKRAAVPVIIRKVTYDLDGGAFNKGTEDEEVGIVERYIEQGTELTFNEIPEKDGYKFVCWEEVIPEEETTANDNAESKEDADAEEAVENEPPRYEENDKYLVTEDVEFKAIWEKV